MFQTNKDFLDQQIGTTDTAHISDTVWFLPWIETSASMSLDLVRPRWGWPEYPWLLGFNYGCAALPPTIPMWRVIEKELRLWAAVTIRKQFENYFNRLYIWTLWPRPQFLACWTSTRLLQVFILGTLFSGTLEDTEQPSGFSRWHDMEITLSPERRWNCEGQRFFDKYDSTDPLLRRWGQQNSPNSPPSCRTLQPLCMYWDWSIDKVLEGMLFILSDSE